MRYNLGVDETLSRRQLFRKAAEKIISGVGLVSVITSCTPDSQVPPTPQLPPTKPHTLQRGAESIIGEIRNSEPGAEVNRDYLRQLLESLRNSGVPLYQMLGEQIGVATSVSSRPLGFPSWLTDDSFPLKVTVNEQNQSVLETGGEMKGEESEFIVEHQDGPITKYNELDYFRVKRIRLGLPAHIRADGALAQALFLAKEYLSLIIKIRFALDAYEVYQPRYVTFKDKSGQPVVDREKQILYGVTFALYQSTQTGNHTWKTMDSLPVYLLSEGLSSAVQGGKIPQAPLSLLSFVKANNHLMDPEQKEVRAAIAQINKGWVAEGTVLPPAGLGQKAFDEPLFSAIQALDTMLYGGGER